MTAARFGDYATSHGIGFLFSVKVSRQMKQIELCGKYGQGKVAIVDDEDYEILSQRRWWANLDGYAIARNLRKGGTPMILMHRLILAPPKHLQIDHINGDRLDNRRCNLRICTITENTYNKKSMRDSSSQYRGVHFCNERKKWCAMVCLKGERFNLGRFDSEIEAAQAYDRKAAELFGEFFRPNLPQEVA